MKPTSTLRPWFPLFLVMGALTLVSVAHGADSGGTASYRMEKKAGLYISYGDPSPTLIGVSAAYSPTDFLKLSVGYGKLTQTTGIDISGSGTLTTTEASATTFRLGVKALLPGWYLTPTLGLHGAHISSSGTGGLKLGGFNDSGSHVYTSFGFDWQTQTGFDLAGGYQLSFKPGVGGNVFLSAGWFVDWLG